MTNVLSTIEVQNTILDIQNYVRKCTNVNNFSFYDNTTYDKIDGFLNNYGVLDKEPIFIHSLLHNRFHKNVQKAYSIIYNCSPKELTACHDRVSWMRPTIGPNDEDGGIYDTPFEYPGLHLDLSPKGYFMDGYDKVVSEFISKLTYQTSGDFVKENNAKHVSFGRRVQGVLNLFDNDEDDG